MRRAALVPALIVALVAWPKCVLAQAPRVMLPTTPVHLQYGTVSNVSLNATTDRFAAIWRAPKTGTLGWVAFALVTTTTAADSTLRVSFQNVSLADGFPDDTDDQYRVTGAITGLDNSVVTTGLITSDGTDGGSKRSVTVGELFAVVIKFETFNAADVCEIRRPSSTGSFQSRTSAGSWYVANKITGSYALLQNPVAMMTLYYDDGSTEVAGHMPATTGTTLATIAYDSADTPDEYGLRFTLPFSCRLRSVHAYLDSDGDFDVVLYDASSATVLASIDDDTSAGNAQFIHPLVVTPTNLTAGTEYVISIKPTTTTPLTLIYLNFGTPYTAKEHLLQMFDWASDTDMVSAKDPADKDDFSVTDVLDFPGIAIEVDNISTGTGSMIFVPVE